MTSINYKELRDFAIVMHEEDNVAISKAEIMQGEILLYKNVLIEIKERISVGNRFAICDIPENHNVKQYGATFGISSGINIGEKVISEKVNNFDVNYKDLLNELFITSTDRMNPKKTANTIEQKFFDGYLRIDGRAGSRNYYLIVPASLCASGFALKIVNLFQNNQEIINSYKNIDGIVAAAHTEGCGCNDIIIERVIKTLVNTIAHPNVGAVLIVDMGCEKTCNSEMRKYIPEEISKLKPIDYLSIQGSGGTRRAIELAIKIVNDRLPVINDVKRVQIPVSNLIIGTECGASDSFSGITANPLIGKVVDRMIDQGGSAILSETPEMMGAERILLERMIDKSVAEKFINGVEYYKTLAEKLDCSFDGNVVTGNKEGGLTNLAVKSLGAILKGGSSTIVDFLDYAQKLERQGLNIMNGPGNDLENMTGLVASGANVILFSTGRGTTEGNLLVPTIKISSTTEVYNKMKEDIDFDAGQIIGNGIDIDALCNQLLDMLIAVASGESTFSEKWNNRTFQIWSAGKLSL